MNVNPTCLGARRRGVYEIYNYIGVALNLNSCPIAVLDSGDGFMHQQCIIYFVFFGLTSPVLGDTWVFVYSLPWQFTYIKSEHRTMHWIFLNW